MTKKKLGIAAAGVAAVAAVIAIPLATTGGSSPPPASLSAPGNVNLTCSEGGCNPFWAYTCKTPQDGTTITINGDLATINGHDYDILRIAPGCTGWMVVHITDASADGIKVTGGGPLIITGTVDCTGIASNLTHQDGVQVLNGQNITMTLDIHCPTATNTQFFVQGISQLPNGVVCDHCEMHPDPTHFHDSTVAASVNSGIRNSLLCPGTVPAFVYLKSPAAQNPVDENNQKPPVGTGGCP